MERNKIAGSVDPLAWAAAFEVMEPKIRRWAFIAAKMAERRQTFAAMAKRHGMSTWYLAACAHGKYPMTTRAIKALESDLSMSLSPFLSEGEIFKCKKGW